MTGSAPRNRATLADGLAGWFQSQHPDWTDIVVSVERPQPGLSSDTLMLDVTTASATERFVARLPPVGDTVFPDYDLARQAQVQNTLRAHGIAAAPALAHETDETWIGTPFLLMPKVAGHTLTTNPAYVQEGWLADQTPEGQRKVITSFIELLASIHRLPVEDLALAELTGGGPSLDGMLDYWQSFLDWATPDREATAIYRSALDWCRDRIPVAAPTSLLWGDPQLTNLVLSEDGGIAAALDFEMAGYGPPEVDLAWFLSLHEHGAATAGAELAGYPGREVIIECFSAALGRPVNDLEWYEVLANIRSGAIVVRIGELMQRAGHSASWTAVVPQRRYLADLIGA